MCSKQVDAVRPGSRPEISTNTSSRIITGARLPITTRNHVRHAAEGDDERDAGTAPAGSTHISGMEAMSVVMWNVTPSIRLDGTNASAIHFALRGQLGGGSVGVHAAAGWFAFACARLPVLAVLLAAASLRGRRHADRVRRGLAADEDHHREDAEPDREQPRLPHDASGSAR